MNVQLQYTISFGKLDAGDPIPWEIELTAEEAAVWQTAVERGEDPNDLPQLQEVLDRAREEIETQEAAVCEELGEENLLDEGCTVTVCFAEAD